MPLKYKISEKDGVDLGIWFLAEPESYFTSKLTIHKNEKEIIENLSERKRLEWLSSRYLLHIMSGRTFRGRFTKDEHGKPHLEDSKYHVSISHSNNHICVIASPQVVGVDIQTYVSKIGRIQRKFVSDQEESMIDPDLANRSLHIIWGAKESLYKAYGKRGLDFIKHIAITELNPKSASGHFKGVVSKEDYYQNFDLAYQAFNEYILVYATESI